MYCCRVCACFDLNFVDVLLNPTHSLIRSSTSFSQTFLFVLVFVYSAVVAVY